MPESTVIRRAAQVLRQVEEGLPADQALRAALPRTRHRSAPAERREISRAVFSHFRWLRWLDPRHPVARRLEEALRLQERFNRTPALFKPETLAARVVPDWCADAIDWPDVSADGAALARPGPIEAAWLGQLQREPTLWIRTKSGMRESVALALGDCLPAAAPARAAAPSTALRYGGTPDLFTTAAYRAGDFEIQDLASQLVGLACAPRPGETWWDACAGEGGKTLHLADLMRNQGLIWASDRSARRLARLKERAARARMFNYRAALWDGTRPPVRTKFDGILVDAPCSGLGTWQRNPHARWTTFPRDVRELAAVQTRLLDRVAGSLKPGGRLVYAVCTLTRAETSAVARTFGAAHPDFEPAPVWPDSAGASTAVVWPQEWDANGMFLATWRRK